MKKIITFVAIFTISAFFLSACGKKPQTQNPVNNTTQTKVVELTNEQKPYLSLIPEEDGHWVNLKIQNIPDVVEEIEYELLYTAQDSGMEIEKGLGGTLKKSDISGGLIQKRLLFGTESCTNGCKYKYDTGVNGGTITLNLFLKGGDSASFEAPFTLKSVADIKKEGYIGLSTEGLKIKTAPTGKGYYILLKNYGFTKGSPSKTTYSIFASNTNKNKVDSISPESVSKTDMSTLIGDYLLK